MARTQDLFPQISRYHRHNTRFTLRVVACIFEFIAFWLAIALGAHIGFDFSAHYQFPCIGTALIVNVFEFITLYFNKRGMHPGAHIALDLLLSSGVLFSGLNDTFAWTAVLLDGWGSRSTDHGRSSVPLGLSLSSIEIIAALLHFVLFILACIAVHKRRKSRFLSERLEADNNIDDIHKVESLTTPKESKSKHDLPGNTTRWVTRKDLQETNGATWQKSSLPEQGVVVPVEQMRDKSPEFLGQSIPMPPVRLTAELATIAEAPAHPQSINIGLGQSISTSEGEAVSAGSPPPYSQVATELPGEVSTTRLEYLQAQQTHLQGQRARLFELQRIDNEEARIREEMDLLRAGEDNIRNG